MTKEAIKNAIVGVINDSNFQVDFIDNNSDGSLLVKVSRPTKCYSKSIQGVVRDEIDIGKFKGSLMEEMN